MLSPLPETQRNLRPLLLVVLVALALVTWQHVASARGRVCLPQRMARAVLHPLQSAFTALHGGASESARALGDNRDLLEQIRDLRDKVNELEVKNIRNNEYFLRYKTILEKQGFPLEESYERVPVRVIGSSGAGRSAWVRIQAPPNRELQVGDIVRETRGLVGRVIEVEARNVAKVFLLTDRQAAVAAIIQRSRDQGMVYPAPKLIGMPTELRLEKLPHRADVRPGDVVLTSGMGGVYPPMLPVGTVRRVDEGPTEEEVIAIIRPFVDFERLDYLYVERPK